MAEDVPKVRKDSAAGKSGAGDGIRTRDIDLGKVALYQLSYSRIRQATGPIVAPQTWIVKLFEMA